MATAVYQSSESSSSSASNISQLSNAFLFKDLYISTLHEGNLFAQTRGCLGAVPD